jgi:carbonic anhydrase
LPVPPDGAETGLGQPLEPDMRAATTTSGFVLSLSLALALALALPAAAKEEHAHWAYSGAEGPEHWGGTCKLGKRQSPIDIDHLVERDLPPLDFQYHAGGYRVVNNGHVVQVDFKPGSRITVDGAPFALKQVHFHAPSENTIDGKRFPLEAHLVHADAKGQLAVVAVLFDEGADNPWLAGISASVPAASGKEKALAKAIDAASLLPAERDYYRFSGSLTTPPCTEGVRWLVLKHPATASAAEIAQLHAAIGHDNNRPLQLLNDRVVQE